MGQAILYCFRCSTQLREAQFEQRKAFRVDAWVCCATWVPEALKSLPPERAQALHGRFALDNRPEGGTRIVVTVPVAPGSRSARKAG